MLTWLLNYLPGINKKVLPFYLLALFGKSEGNKSNSLFTVTMKTFDISSFLTGENETGNIVWKAALRRQRPREIA